MKFLLSKADIDTIAGKYKYTCFDFQENIGLVRYTDGSTKINIYLTTMTVATCLEHPIKGKTQLFRKNVTRKELDEIFSYPRKHTGKGYYVKNK